MMIFSSYPEKGGENNYSVLLIKKEIDHLIDLFYGKGDGAIKK